MLLFMIIMSTGVLLVPGLTAEKSHQSAWIAIGFTSLFGFLCLWTVLTLGKQFPLYTLQEYITLILGKPLGKAIGGIYIVFFLMANIITVREFSEFVTTTAMPATSGLVFDTIIVLIGAYAASKGIEVIARAAQFVLPLFVFSLLFLFICLLPVSQFGRLQPFLEGGIQPVIWGAIPPFPVYGEVIVLAILLPHLNKPKEAKRKGAMALLSAAIFLTTGMMITLMIYGPYLTGDLLFPFWYLSRYIEYGTYLQRIEGIISLLWAAGIFIKVAVYQYVVCYMIAKILELKKHKIVIYLMALILIPSAAFLFSNTAELREFVAWYWPILGIIFQLGLPLILLLIALIRKNQGWTYS